MANDMCCAIFHLISCVTHRNTSTNDLKHFYVGDIVAEYKGLPQVQLFRTGDRS